MTAGLKPRPTRERVKPTIVRNIPRADADAIRILGEHGVATVHEAQGRTGLMRPFMRPIYPSARAAGSAITVSCAPGDNMMIHAAIEVCKPGDVIVADADGVVVVPRADAAAVAKASQERVAKEEQSRARLKSGELGLDFYGLRAKLAELGVQYVDGET